MSEAAVTKKPEDKTYSVRQRSTKNGDRKGRLFITKLVSPNKEIDQTNVCFL